VSPLYTCLKPSERSSKLLKVGVSTFLLIQPTLELTIIFYTRVQMEINFVKHHKSKESNK